MKFYTIFIKYKVQSNHKKLYNLNCKFISLLNIKYNKTIKKLHNQKHDLNCNLNILIFSNQNIFFI